MTKNNKIVSESLKNSGLKQKEFAERLGISRSHLSMIVAGSGKASDQLAQLVRLKFADFISRPQKEKTESNTNPEPDKEQDMLQKELLEAYRKNAELYERVLLLEEELRGKQLPPTEKRTVKKKKIS